LLPSILGIYLFLKYREKEFWVPGIWFLCLPFLLTLFFFQPAKLDNGSHLILCILATYGLMSIRAIKLLNRRNKFLLIIILVVLTMPSNIVVYANSLYRHVLKPHSLPSMDRFYFPETDVWSGFRWLDQNTKNDDTVMCSRFTGWMIPGFAGNRSLLGHLDFSANLSEKTSDFFRYYLSTNESERRQILDKYNIKYVWVGPDETFFLKTQFVPDSSLALVFQEGSVSIYKYQ
jgi:hypothetical protein